MDIVYARFKKPDYFFSLSVYAFWRCYDYGKESVHE